jgi:hypothetical protein
VTVAAQKTKILYIGGYSRSGSTLLLRLLGEHPGIVAVGELFDVWQRSYIQNQLCGCGQSFRECDFWIQVTAETFGCKPDNVPAAELNQTRSRVQGHSRLPLLWLPPLRSPKYRRELHEYASLLGRMYVAVQRVASSEVVVDSSKVPQYAWILAEAGDIELHMVHLIRDSRATAFSWQRQRIRPEITSHRAYMDRHSLVRSASEWNAFNYLLRNRRRKYASYTVIKYEDLVADPYRELQKVMDKIGGGTVAVSGRSDVPVSLRVSHTASGNPGRFQTGQVPISLDSEWTHAMSGSARLIVTGLTAPSLARYNYPLLVSASRPSARVPARPSPGDRTEN